jgi:hypothetical protein
MKEIIKKIINKLCCSHEWEEVSHIKTYSQSNNRELPIQIDYLYCCKKCGKFKQITIK